MIRTDDASRGRSAPTVRGRSAPTARGRFAPPTRALATAFALFLALGACEAPEAGGDAGAAADTATLDTMAAAGAAIDETAPLVNPNEADETALAAAGLDQQAVADIMSRRPFPNMIPLDRILAARMDSVARENLYRRVFIPIDLNNATEEEILLIPGVGPRMAHEFEEYRPYRGIEQFRREIGKYVDDAEVARLERYVTIR